METFEEKRKQYQKQIDNNPAQFEPRYAMGKLYYEQASREGSPESSAKQLLQQSAEHLEKADLIKPGNRDNLTMLREIYTITNHSDKAKGINERLNA